MLVAPQNHPLREVFHWAEQVFFALVLLIGLALAFYALVIPGGARTQALDAAVRLVQNADEAGVPLTGAARFSVDITS